MERAINRVVIQTSPYVHNKSRRGDGREDPERIEAIARALGRLGDEVGIDEQVHIFSTKAEAEAICEQRGIEFDEEESISNYGSLTGTNEHKHEHLGVVGASQHFGEDHVRLNAAYAGARPTDPDPTDAFKPRRWADEVHANIEARMRQGGAYEAITRMGRNDTDLTLLAVDTSEIPEWLQVVDQSDRVKRLSPAAEVLYEYISNSNGAVQIKEQGDGAVDHLDYSAVRLYEAAKELKETGLVEACDETGKYNAEKLRTADEEPVSPGIRGLKKQELTGSAFREAQNPDWDVITLEPEHGDATDTQQMPFVDSLWGT